MDETYFPRGGISLDEKKEKPRFNKDYDLFKDAVEKSGIKGKKKRTQNFPKPYRDGPLFSNKRQNWKQKTYPGNSKQHFGKRNNRNKASFKGPTLKPLEAFNQQIHISSIYLCFVKEIQDYSLKMAFPNGRLGNVPITNISDAYRKRLEDFSHFSEETNTPNEKLPSLADLFTVGMLLPCKVIDFIPSSPLPQLSINPRVINKSLSVRSVMKAQKCYGSISDVEDTGYVVDLGIRDKMGFLKKENALSFIEKCNRGQGLKVGQSMWFGILHTEGNTSTVAEKYFPLTLCQRHLNKEIENRNMKLKDVLPRVKVTGKIIEILERGLIVSCLEQRAGIYQSHLRNKLSSYNVGNEIHCCVLSISPETKLMTLSDLPHIVNYHGEPIHLLGFGSLYVGCLVPNATVLRVKESKGVFVELEGGVTGLADNNSIEEYTEYQKGSSHRCVVTELNYEENKARVSFKEKTIREMADPAGFLGDIVTGKFKRMEQETVVVQVMGKFPGKISLKQQQTPGLKYTPGTEFKCRVLSVSKNGLFTLTNKSWALEPKYPILAEPSQVERGQLLQGYVKADRERHIEVNFCGELYGMIKKEYVDNTRWMPFGQPVVCHVLYYWVKGFVMCFPEDVEDFSIPENSAPFIIGKGGHDIHRLERETFTSISFNGNMCRVCGRRANREKVKEHIMMEVAKWKKFESSSPWLAKKRSLSEDSEEASSCKKVKLTAETESEEVSDLPEHTKELNIRDEDVKMVIGRQGRTVKEIQARTGTKVVIIDGDVEGASKLCRISGPEENISEAQELIENILSSLKASDLQEHTKELNIQDEDVGKVIGRYGRRVKEIQTKTGTKVVITDGEVEGAGKLCRISGPEENISKAQELIENILSSFKATDLPEHTKELNILDEVVGKVIGTGGCIIKDIQSKCGAKVEILDGEVEGAGKLCRISGPEKNILKAQELIENIISSKKASDLPEHTKELNIPDEVVGKVIGTGGCIIKDIQSKCGTKVEIIDGEVEGAGKLCRISGPEKNILKAQELIENIISSKKFRRPQEIIEEYENNEEGDKDQEPDGIVEVNIMVPSSCVQELLQNEKFQKLQTESQPKVSIDQEEEDADTVCSIKGKEEDVMLAKKTMEKLLNKIEGKKETEKPTLQLNNSLMWDTEFKLPTTKVESSSEESDNEETTPRPAKKTKDQKRKEKLEEEKRLYEYERKKLEGKVVPETADDFDRLVVNSPDSSVIWLRYMAFHLETSEIDKARNVAERALKTISFREEGEKRNIWLAYLNLENMYGTSESIGKVLSRAITQSEPLDIYFPLVKMYTESSKMEEAERLYSLMVKKYSSRKEVWTSFGDFHFQQGRPDSARKLLQRSLKSLEDKNHVDTIVNFAKMEFKYGEPERGKTMFENVLNTYPKRTDVWSVYVDLLTKLKDFSATRGVYQKVIGLSLPTKKIKFFFKKYLEFEEKFGTEAQVAEVKKKAVEYVESGGAMD